ncbi:4'-phosphopantetheinyl transferase superfamily protein [Bradyrhizobium sp. AUGA SZCCT0274]|uniref:4'-phosphopantetheinyl transferase family protein n=1 Tax=Bradyrhizobium sp. AUGA SZCCT0274 TaxID=2807670 RepID=UPI001BA74943|nr:4'-phosphopantetheinyl transferase superfamily protein [Bradyrhizobium sp. AUGA SZCCT0274]MBR1240310.1 4'-phosphopantetheinyl transferase superfamily protein [Bradyrhizobium sp. AUGA SZCCT0274]
MQAILSPFPDWIGFGSASADEPELSEPSPEEWAALPAGCVAARRQTFALGRAAARCAFEALGRDPVPVLINGDRSPIWPEGTVGSITHTDTCAAAAVAPAARTAGLGLDIEDITKTQTIDIARLVASPAEQVWLAGDPDRLIRVFSAKEAIYKAFYPRHGKFFGFEAVELEPVLDGFRATLLVPLAAWPAGSRVNVRSVQAGALVVSAVLLPLAPSDIPLL